MFFKARENFSKIAHGPFSFKTLLHNPFSLHIFFLKFKICYSQIQCDLFVFVFTYFFLANFIWF
ncbi:hypothetical protein EBS43_09740 [bacterium]|nr:hypothetical protein [bacterium]